MCGIVGHVAIAGQLPDTDAVKNAINLIEHRGPDGQGIAEMDEACLGHVRLSIIDLEGSFQPWFSHERRYAIVFNGEIYNYIELRERLRAKGVSFVSQGDTEVLLAMYIQYGPECLGYLNGMFAVAIWDSHERKLFLARDRLGKKPLYYSHYNGGVIFASEIQALTVFSGMGGEVDLSAVNDFFAYQYIGGTKTIYRDIHKLPAAHFMLFSPHDKDCIKYRYWQPPLPDPKPCAFSDAVDELRNLIDDAVRIRLRSDVPLGAFLSGGIDSAIIVASMKHHAASIDTFTVGFPEESFDERQEACDTASFFGSRHHEQELAGLHVADNIKLVLSAFHEPYADPSALPTWFLCQYARKNVTVALSGDGGDELFSGYQRYRAVKWVKYLLSLPESFRTQLIQRVVDKLPETDGYYGGSLFKKIKLLMQMVRRMSEAKNDLLAQTFTLSERQRLFNGGFESAHNHVDDFGLTGMDMVTQMSHADLQTYLVDDILVKVDRMSMRNGLEVRAPLLDYRVVEFACRLPAKYKMYKGQQKYVLQQSFKQRLPEKVLGRRKHGFALPISSWLRDDLRSFFEEQVLDAFCPEFLNRSEIEMLWLRHQRRCEDNGFKLWSLLSFFCWLNGRKK